MILVDLGPIREMLVKQLFQEGLNASTCYVAPEARNEDIHKWVLATRDLDHSQGPIAALTTSLMSSLWTGSAPMTHPRAPKQIDLVGNAASQAICSVIAPGQNLEPDAPDAIGDFLGQRIADHNLLKHQHLQTPGMVLLSPASKSRPW